MELTSEDVQALDLLAAPKAIVVRLRRRVKSHINPEKTLESFALRDSIEHSQLAVWWASSEGTEDADHGGHGRGQRRFVNGELHLRSDTKPSSAMAHFRIEVRFPVVL
ncbi:unnamed protein product [Cyclocybe aegerita]|uniref:Uncharacterized protein n=1 Tax=Cyclocybe aegerita TaxID=1973307 RepID=A0A8S0W8S3_CYCAE|nr:unnamed protein product [Cyclocybe aegerita]